MENIPKVQTKLVILMEYLKPYLAFLNSHMVNFITHDYWSKFIPYEIRSEIEEMGHNNFMDLFRDVHSDSNQSTISCENTKDFLKNSSSMRSVAPICITLEDLCSKLNIDGYYFPLLGVQKIMSSKKTHEVNMVSAITNFLCKNNSEIPLTVVDIGGGKGYLSSLLSMEYHLNVLGLDSNKSHTQSAAVRNKKLQRYWNGISRKDVIRTTTNNLSEGQYKQVTQFVDENTNLLNLVQQHFPDEEISGICMTGLHTCGNLAPSSLRLYNNNKEAKAIVNIGCCYHLLDEEFLDIKIENDTKIDYGFPMSEFLRSKKFCIGRNARMLSMQSVDRRINLDENLSHSLLYRALLQVILKQENIEDSKIQVGKIGSKCKTFKEYVQKVSEKFELDFKLSEDDLEDILKAHEKDWSHLQSYHALKMSFAPVLELLIILDRYLYLLEKDNSETFLVKLFDPVISPRCYALISLK